MQSLCLSKSRYTSTGADGGGPDPSPPPLSQFCTLACIYLPKFLSVFFPGFNVYMHACICIFFTMLSACYTVFKAAAWGLRTGPCSSVLLST